MSKAGYSSPTDRRFHRSICMTSSIRIDNKHSLHEMVFVALKHVLPGLSGEVRCTFNNDRVCLSGVVSSYYEKQIAQEALLKMPEISNVMNDLKVSRN